MEGKGSIIGGEKYKEKGRSRDGVRRAVTKE
jgi:hypothetical protein